jgi:hypothetical protein
VGGIGVTNDLPMLMSKLNHARGHLSAYGLFELYQKETVDFPWDDRVLVKAFHVGGAIGTAFRWRFSLLETLDALKFFRLDSRRAPQNSTRCAADFCITSTRQHQTLFGLILHCLFFHPAMLATLDAHIQEEAQGVLGEMRLRINSLNTILPVQKTCNSV